MSNRQISIFDLPLEDYDKLIVDQTINENRMDKLADALNDPGTIIADVKLMIEDLLKLVFAEEFNKQWNKHNYILRNIDKQRITDKGLHPVRSAAAITLPRNKDKYTKEELREITIKAVNDLIVTTEVRLMRELVQEFRQIVMLDPDNTFKEYRPILREISDQDLLTYFIDKTPTELKNGLSIEVNNSWQWLTFCSDARIMTKTYDIEDDEAYDIYEVYMTNSVAFAFDSKFVENILKSLSYLQDVLNSPQGQRFKRKYEPVAFRTLCCKKRQD